MEDIIKCYEKSNKRKTIMIKVGLLFIFIIILTLIVTVIFSASYNKFKVYNVVVQSNDLYETRGVYVETKVNDTLFLESIGIKNYKVEPLDVISINLYYKNYFFMSIKSNQKLLNE